MPKKPSTQSLSLGVIRMTELDRTYATWQACPICSGRKTMPMGFYPGQTMATNTDEQQCRTCFGLGVIMVPVEAKPENDGEEAG